MVRRPMTTLVEQGIMPSPKTSPALHEQKQRLERAKMHDMLRSKIARRPDRQELVHRHILEDVRPGVDPSLCEKQRQLKRAKLADSLSNQLLQRPGPLELIQKNILHPDDRDMEQAVKEGQIPFKPTNEGIPLRHVELPMTYGSFDEDSNSEGVKSPEDFSPAALTPSTPSNSFGGLSPLPMDSVTSSVSPSHGIFSPFSPTLSVAQPVTLSTSTAPAKSESHDNILQKAIAYDDTTAFSRAYHHQRRASDVGVFVVPTSPNFAHPHNVVTLQPATATPQSPSRSSSSSSTSSTSLTLSKAAQLPGSQAYSQRGAPGKDQTSRKSKKAKPKGQTSKQRTIKFHEYKVRLFNEDSASSVCCVMSF